MKRLRTKIRRRINKLKKKQPKRKVLEYKRKKKRKNISVKINLRKWVRIQNKPKIPNKARKM